MTKVDATLRESIRKDKESMTTKQLQEKYNLSRSSIQRIKLPDLESRAKEFEPPPNPQQEALAEKFIKELLPVPQLPQGPQPIPELPRQPIIQKILMNVDSFPAHYPFITDRNAFNLSLTDKTPSQLKELLETLEQTRSVNNLSAQMKQIFFVGAKVAEVVGSKIKLKTQGFSGALLQQQEELDYIFKEMAISYGDSFTKATRPELRLAMLFGMTLLQVDNQNRIKELQATTQPEEKYSDL